MEPIELMSPHVAVPVIGVIICAVLVFALGFRSPVQPPSFKFEEPEKKSKKEKKSKSPKVNMMRNTMTIQLTSLVYLN